MKKILFLINNLCQGGAEKVLVNLVNNLDKSKYDVTLMTVCNEGVNRQFLDKDIKYKYMFGRHIPKIYDIFKVLSPQLLHKIFIKEKYDIEVAYLHGPCARIISGCSNREAKLFSWIHGTKINKKHASAGFRKFEEAKECYGKFSKICCVSQSVEEAFNKIFGYEDKTVTIYNVNETDRIAELGRVKTEITFSESEFNIVSVGSIIPVKAFDRLARIQKKLNDIGYKTHMYILGKGDTSKIEKYLSENNIENTWTFLGYRTNPYAYVSKADLYVCSSLREALSTSVTEAMLLGVPVVTTDCSGMREILGDNEAGLITENNEDALFDGIKKVIDNPDLLKKYKEKTKERARLFDKYEIIKQHEKLFDNIL